MAKGGFRGGSYGGGGGFGGVNMNMIKQAQKMQQDMLKMQEALEQETYEATAGGVVKAVVSGKGELTAHEPGIEIRSLASRFKDKIADPYWVRYAYSEEEQNH